MNAYKFSKDLTASQKRRLVQEYSRIYDLWVFEGEDNVISIEAWDMTFVVTKELLRRLIKRGAANDVIEIINERGDVEMVSRGQAMTSEVDHDSEENDDNDPMNFIPDDAVLVGNEIHLRRDLEASDSGFEGDEGLSDSDSEDSGREDLV